MAEIRPTTSLSMTAYIPNHAQPFALLRIAWGVGAGWAPELGIGPDHRNMGPLEQALVNAAARDDKVEACTLAGVFIGQLQLLYHRDHGKRLKVTVAETPEGVIYVGQFDGKQLEVMIAPSTPPIPRWKGVQRRARAAAKRHREHLVDSWRALTPCEQAQLRSEFADDDDALL